MSWSFIMVVSLTLGCTPPPSAESDATPPAPNDVEPTQPPAANVAAPQASEVLQPQAAEPPANTTTEGPELAVPENESQEPIVQADESAPQLHTAFFRADSVPAEIAPVLLSKGHENVCRVKVGDQMPEIELPQLGAGDQPTQLADLYGEKATVVVFWKADRRMAAEQLADLGPDVVSPFGDLGVAVVGIVVEDLPQKAQDALQEAKADFPNLLDVSGQAFAKVGSEKLPRTYLLDPQGKILWFDIEYSLATRRELHQALRAVVGESASVGG